jgi:hypothetical protein
MLAQPATGAKKVWLCKVQSQLPSCAAGTQPLSSAASLSSHSHLQAVTAPLAASCLPTAVDVVYKPIINCPCQHLPHPAAAAAAAAVVWSLAEA